MKKLFYVFILFALVSCGAQQTATISSDAPQTSTVQSAVHVTAQSIIAQMDKGKYKEGELLVKFKSGVVTTSSLKIHQRVGASVTKKFTVVPNLELVILPQGQPVKDAVIKYMSDPNVEYAEPNYIRRVAVLPNDTYFPQQWALHNIGQFAGGTEDADIDAPEAWDISQGSSSIIVAVLDTGIDYNHPDLVNNIWINIGETSCVDGIDNDGNGYIDDCKGWDFSSCAQFSPLPPYNCITSKSPDKYPMDDNGHGTHGAGIIGAGGNNGVGIAGVMWNVKLMALKFLNADGEGTTADEIAGIQYAIVKGAKIINASFGGEAYSQAEYDAINAANAAGILFVAAAGNGGEDGIGDNNDLTPFYPASYNLPNIISVAATDQNDIRVPFSNFGPNSVHVAAPGVYILSTIPQNLFSDKEFSSGTSMATPHVSGLAGLLYSYYDGIHNTQFNLSQVRETIFRYGDELPTLTGWIQTGKRINAYWAMSSLLIPTNLSATATAPTQISITWSDNATGEDGYKIERKVSGGSYTQIAVVAPNTTTYPDSELSPTTTYTYRVRAYNTIPADSSYSNEASATTPAVPVEPSGGGGGCSIGAWQNTPTAVADFVVMLIPLLFVVVMKFRRRV